MGARRNDVLYYTCIFKNQGKGLHKIIDTQNGGERERKKKDEDRERKKILKS